MTFSGMGNMVAIDGKQFDMDRIDLRAKVGEKEVWEIKNTRDMMGGMIHPFHLHGVQFKVIIRNGNAPPANEQGWKDTIALYPGDNVRIEVTFPEKGIFYVPLPYPRARRQWHNGSSFSIMKIPTKLEEKDYVKILIVDDEASILDIVEAYLSAKGYQVFRALSGNEALTKVDVVQPDLIVLDLMLPGLSGLEVCKKIRDSSTVPIIMLTAKTAEKDILEGLSLGLMTTSQNHSARKSWLLGSKPFYAVSNQNTEKKSGLSKKVCWLSTRIENKYSNKVKKSF